MQIYSYQSMKPQLAGNNFIAPSAILIGELIIGENVNIWFNSVIRADVNKIIIGKNTNVQDLCMLHVTAENDLQIGENVTIGHSVILHGCQIGEGCLIGMGAKVLDGAVIGKNSLVAAGAVVPPGKVYPANSLIMGVPAIVKKELDSKTRDQISNHYKSYLGYAKIYQTQEFKPV